MKVIGAQDALANIEQILDPSGAGKSGSRSMYEEHCEAENFKRLGRPFWLSKENHEQRSMRATTVKGVQGRKDLGNSTSNDSSSTP